VNLLEFLFILPKVASIDLILAGIFVKWAWKWKIFNNWLVTFPNLNGTWEGTIQTSWINPETGLIPGPIPAIITINQSFSRISCVMHTSEMKSYSIAEEFRIDSDQQIKQLVYTYLSKPRILVENRSIPHEGTVVLNIIGNPVYKLDGYYWTSRKTTGEITFAFKDVKIVDELPQNFGRHPVSQSV
jgi:hypothetical protein